MSGLVFAGLEIAYQLALQNERQAEASALHIVQRVHSCEERITTLEQITCYHCGDLKRRHFCGATIREGQPWKCSLFSGHPGEHISHDGFTG